MANKWNVYVLNQKERKINMLTEKDYCDYETCVALMGLGYLEHEILIYDFNLLLYEAQKWLREEKFLLIVVDRLLNGEYVFSIVDILNYSEEKNGTANSYEEALSEGIKDAVKILKEDETIHR